MIKNKQDVFNTLDLKEFTVPSLVKEPDKRGYLYLVQNKNYPELIKFGRTIDLHKRLQAYNSDQPEPNVSVIAVSCLLSNANIAEEKIIAYMRQICSPVGYTKEWFDVKYQTELESKITEAEKVYDSIK